MSSSIRTVLVLLPTMSALLMMFCSIGELAGGSGAGNPGGTVTVALKAEVSIGMAKTTSDTFSKQISGTSNDSLIAVTDMNGLQLFISEIGFSCEDFRFMLDPSENAGEILSSFRDRSSLLSNDTRSLILGGGPYFCNGLTGQMQPKIDTIRLPVAKYTGIMLSFRDRGNFLSRETFGRQLFYIAGTFFYCNRLCRFYIGINHPFSPLISFAGGIFTLSTGDTTHIELRFNADQWFKGIDLKKAIDNGDLQLNSNGEIFIGGRPNDSPNQKIEVAIQNSFAASGKLIVY
jgi:hypothetical protein